MGQSSEILLMVDPVGDQIAPVSRQAFLTVRSPVAQVISRNCVSLFLDSLGQVTRIDDIRISGSLMFNSIGLWFGRPAPVEVEFATVNVDLGDIRTMVLDAIEFSQARHRTVQDWWLFTADRSTVIKRIEEAQTLAELHGCIELPPIDKCLELL